MSPLKPEQQRNLDLYRPLVEAFIKEVNPYTTPEALAAEMDLYPIQFDGKISGLVGFSIQTTPVGKAAIIKLLYLGNEHRGDRLGPVLSSLFDQFAQQGITHVEGWALPWVSRWLEGNWGLVPKLKVFHEDIAQLRAKILTKRS